MQNQKIIDLISKNLFSEAKIECKILLKIYPENSDIFHLLGIIFLKEKNFKEAIDLIYKSINLNRNNYSAFNNLGTCHSNLGNHNESLKNYDKAIKLKPNYAEAYNNRGVVLKNLGRIDEAIESYNKAIEIKPGYYDPINNLGFIFQLQKDYKKALIHFIKCINAFL